MNETARHDTLDRDPSARIVSGLEAIALQNLSFVQLRRLQKVLQQSLTDVAAEFARRAAEEDSGDTVRVPARQPDQ